MELPSGPTLRHRKHGAARIPGDYKLASSSVRVPKLECVFGEELSPRYLEICRTYYNYCLIGKDEKTPAMRLGLAKASQTADAILRFS
jgi:hypothetical protein